MKHNLVFLKLGGSLITIKDQPHTPRLEVLERLAQEIKAALAQEPNLQILVGHGSGSFGHVPASKYQTRQGVKSSQEWRGFIEVWYQAAELNHLVMQAFHEAKLPALAFPPCTTVIARQGRVAKWNLDTLLQALKEDLLPVIYGDVVFDTILGGTILSTEDLFAHLVSKLHPARLLIAGDEPGVWGDFPDKAKLLIEITPEILPQIESGLSGSAGADVTGGMAGKVRQIIAMVSAHPGLSASIFSGNVPGNVKRALCGERLGTEIHG